MGPATQPAAASRKPNIVFILVDTLHAADCRLVLHISPLLFPSDLLMSLRSSLLSSYHLAELKLVFRGSKLLCDYRPILMVSDLHYEP
jgi:hypothetical protein